VSDLFRTPEDFAEEAHQLYVVGQYDEALDRLRDGVTLFPYAAELHVGMGYARLAREEFAWARLAFEDGIALEPNHEDGLAGLGETLLKVGQQERGLKCFQQIRDLGYEQDHDLMMQIGRALFREGFFDEARKIFAIIVHEHPESAEAASCVAYTLHRLGDESGCLLWLRRALELDSDDVEVHVYLGNVLYDRGDYNESLYHYGRTTPADHFEELAIWRLIELRKSVYHLSPDDPELKPWVDRIGELVVDPGTDEILLSQIEATRPDGSFRDPKQLDFFGAALVDLPGMRKRAGDVHRVALSDGTTYQGSFDDIVLQMKQDDREWAGSSISDYMESIARQESVETGVNVPTNDTESFIRGMVATGRLEITH
jgi:tetratricopeptide (TPR) repeat protein